MNEYLQVDNLHKSFDDTPVLSGLSLDVPKGETLAILGPSGSGKTTLLRIIAGLEAPDAGRVVLDGDVLTDGSFVVPPEQRGVGLVFQDGALFPHLTVGENVGYGVRGPDRDRRIAEALAMVDLAGMENRRPSTLSGGQARRVAIARALAPQPRVLLLDEPFSSLDTELRVRVRTDVARLLRELGITAVYVTHDQEEAFVIGDRVAVMREGAIVQSGTPSEIYRAPSSPWIAGFVGDANLLPATAGGDSASSAVGSVPLTEPAHGPVTLLVRPEHLTLVPGGRGRVDSVEFYGHDTTYRVSQDGDSLLVRSMAAPRFRTGDAVEVRATGEPSVAFGVEPAEALDALDNARTDGAGAPTDYGDVRAGSHP